MQMGFRWSFFGWENGLIQRAYSHSVAGSIDPRAWGWAATAVSNWFPPPPPPGVPEGCTSRFSHVANGRPGSQWGILGSSTNSLWSLGGHLRGDHSKALIDEQFHSWEELMSLSQKAPSLLPDWLYSHRETDSWARRSHTSGLKMYPLRTHVSVLGLP